MWYVTISQSQWRGPSSPFRNIDLVHWPGHFLLGGACGLDTRLVLFIVIELQSCTKKIEHVKLKQDVYSVIPTTPTTT